MNGAMIVRSPLYENSFDFGNKVLLNQVNDLYENNPNNNHQSYFKLCQSLIKSGISPTSSIARSVDKVLTAKMLYDGTSPID